VNAKPEIGNGKPETDHPQPFTPIRLFVSDIDGCLCEPYQAYELERMAELTAMTRVPEAPLFGLCSGRSYPYVEAVAQALDLRGPALFESGGGWFDLTAARIRWNPAFTPEVEHELAEVRAFLLADVVPGTALSYDFGKRTQAGIVGPDTAAIARLVPVVERFVTERFPELVVFHTAVSIDVLPASLTKRQAMEWLASDLGLETGQIAYIGDTRGDIPALQAVGLPLAPANADDAVKAVVRQTMSGPVIEGVIEAFRLVTTQNGGRF
jgi:HAD superfamily hydrolase (TIGR01484 family)